METVSRIIAIVRHGEYQQPPEVPSAWLPHPLTENGRAQARELAKELILVSQKYRCPISTVLRCSQLLRAYETASICAKYLESHFGQEFLVREHAELNERCLGSAANCHLDQIDEILEQDPRYSVPPKNWKSQPDFCLPLAGAESLRSAGRRVAQLINDNLDQHCDHLSTQAETKPSWNRALQVFVGHGAAFRFAAVQMGIMTDSQALGCSMYHARALILQRDSTGGWKHIDGQWKARSSSAGMD